MVVRATRSMFWGTGEKAGDVYVMLRYVCAYVCVSVCVSVCTGRQGGVPSPSVDRVVGRRSSAVW